MPTRINQLPTELRQLIVDHLAVIAHSFNPKGYFEGNYEHIAEIKALRLSCRAFVDLTYQYLFSSIWLFMTDESFAKLRCIASTPDLAKHVRRLKIFWNLFDASSLENEDSYQSLLEVTPMNAVSEETMKHGWSTVQSLLSQHKRLSPQIGDILTETLPLFPKLLELHPGVAWEVLRHRKAMQLKDGTIQKLARETLLRGPFVGWHLDLHDGKQLYNLFRAMDQTRCEGQKLVLFNCGANISSEFLDFPDDMLPIAQAVASGLIEVRLRLETEKEDDLDPIVEDGHGSRFLGWLEMTERLCLQTSINSFLIGLELLMPKNVVMPNLQYLALYRLTTSVECLLDVLERHKMTLNTISIAETTLMTGSWRKVFTKFREQEEIREFQFEENHLLKAGGNPKDPITVSGTELEAPMKNYVFCGGEWPDKGCEDLNMEARS